MDGGKTVLTPTRTGISGLGNHSSILLSYENREWKGRKRVGGWELGVGRKKQKSQNSELKTLFKALRFEHSGFQEGPPGTKFGGSKRDFFFRENSP
jgi:hypothetical protein